MWSVHWAELFDKGDPRNIEVRLLSAWRSGNVVWLKDAGERIEPNSILISAISCVVFDCCNSTESWNFTYIPIKISNYVSKRLVAGDPADLTEDSIWLSLERAYVPLNRRSDIESINRWKICRMDLWKYIELTPRVQISGCAESDQSRRLSAFNWRWLMRWVSLNTFGNFFSFMTASG